MKSFVVTLYLVPDLRVGDAAAQLDELNVVGLTGLQCSRDQVASLICKEMVVIIMVSTDKARLIMA